MIKRNRHECFRPNVQFSRSQFSDLRIRQLEITSADCSAHCWIQWNCPDKANFSSERFRNYLFGNASASESEDRYHFNAAEEKERREENDHTHGCVHRGSQRINHAKSRRMRLTVYRHVFVHWIIRLLRNWSKRIDHHKNSHSARSTRSSFSFRLAAADRCRFCKAVRVCSRRRWTSLTFHFFFTHFISNSHRKFRVSIYLFAFW